MAQGHTGHYWQSWKVNLDSVVSKNHFPTIIPHYIAYQWNKGTVYANLSSSSCLLSCFVICESLVLALGWDEAGLVSSPQPTVLPLSSEQFQA